MSKPSRVVGRTVGGAVPPSGRFRRAGAAVALSTLVLSLLTVVGLATPASALGVNAPTTDAVSGFPVWYQDSAGNRVEPCVDPADANCVLGASATFDPAQPVTFPGNYPDEFFYALATSDRIPTTGCNGASAPGTAEVRLALEGAFFDGAAAFSEQMVFGRVRVKVTSGLCPNTSYRFDHPFGSTTITTNDAGAVPANAGTTDVGCQVGPPKCDFSLANGSVPMGTAAGGGFLRWSTAAPAAPAGYLGDPAVLHPVTGGTNGNAFSVKTPAGGDLGLTTSLFSVAGKKAGSLLTGTKTLDFGGQAVTTTATRTVTVTNVDSVPVTVGAAAVAGADAAQFVPTATTCPVAPATLARDASCTVTVRFQPTGVGGARTATLTVPSAGGVRSPLAVPLAGFATTGTQAPAVAVAPASVTFPDTRVRTLSAPQSVTVTNTGTAPLGVTGVTLNGNGGTGSDHFRIAADTCSVGGSFVPPGGTCVVQVQYAPLVSDTHTTTLQIASNAPGAAVPLTGTGTGGSAAVSPTRDPQNGFADWYRDEAGVTVGQCIDAADPNCIVLPDDFYDPARGPVHFPDNFPAEFFYQVATSDNVPTPGCNGSAPGRALIRTAVEGTFTDGPLDGDQTVFGRIRIRVTSGLCPNTTYTFTHPYGSDQITTDGAGAIPTRVGTDDVGCFPTPGNPCDFSLPLNSRVFGGLVRWDPTVAPAAPAGYLGDGATLHAIAGAPYRPDGVNPANYFKITAPDGQVVGQTNQFTVMGKLRGPVEATAGLNASGTLDLGVSPVGTPTTGTVTLSNTGITPVLVSSVVATGDDAADFDPTASDCPGTTVQPGATCTLSVTFTPSAVGTRTTSLVVRHDGLNDPFTVPVTGVGQEPGTAPAIGFSPRSVAFAPLHVGDISPERTVTVSNIGGTAPLDVTAVTLTGLGASGFTVGADTCTGAPVGVGASCTVKVRFTPNGAGALTAALSFSDNAPGGTHAVALTGTASSANPAVSATVDSAHGFPQWYGDGTGTRLEPCLAVADPNCIVLGDPTFDPGQPEVFPTNFPSEFFYAFAETDLISLPGCPGAGIGPGTALVRFAIEGAFTGAPAAGEQITFGRVRVSATGGLCPSTPYVVTTPYGPVSITTDTNGVVVKNGATTNVGCGVTPCAFADALGSPVAQSFLRWDPAVGPTAPDGYLGDGRSFHRVVGGTARDLAGEPITKVVISDLAGVEWGGTDRFVVAGKVAGPLQTTPSSVDLGHQALNTASAASTVTVRNVSASPVTLQSLAFTGPDATRFAISGGTCAVAGSVPVDGSCTVQVRFTPTAAGLLAANLVVTPVTGPPATVGLSGTGDEVLAPVASVTPTSLTFATVTAPNAATQQVSVRNTGNAPLTVSGAAITAGATDYTVSANGCLAPVAPNGACTVTVRFRPSAVGTRTGTLRITHNAAGPALTVPLTGTGAGSTFSLSPSPVSFGGVKVTTTKTATVTVKNTGTVTFRPSVALGAGSIGGADAARFSVTATTCTVNLLPGRTCSVTVSFRPTAVRAHTATLTVNGDGTSLPPSVLTTLTGTGK